MKFLLKIGAACLLVVVSLRAMENEKHLERSSWQGPNSEVTGLTSDESSPKTPEAFAEKNRLIPDSIRLSSPKTPKTNEVVIDESKACYEAVLNAVTMTATLNLEALNTAFADLFNSYFGHEKEEFYKTLVCLFNSKVITYNDIKILKDRLAQVKDLFIKGSCKWKGTSDNESIRRNCLKHCTHLEQQCLQALWYIALNEMKENVKYFWGCTKPCIKKTLWSIVSFPVKIIAWCKWMMGVVKKGHAA